MRRTLLWRRTARRAVRHLSSARERWEAASAALAAARAAVSGSAAAAAAHPRAREEERSEEDKGRAVVREIRKTTVANRRKLRRQAEGRAPKRPATVWAALEAVAECAEARGGEESGGLEEWPAAGVAYANTLMEAAVCADKDDLFASETRQFVARRGGVAGDDAARQLAARTAVELYERAAAAGVRDAHFNLGTALYAGVTTPGGRALVEADPAAAARSMERAAELGDEAAQFWVGHAYLSGEDGLPLDEARGETWLGRAAEAGHPAAVHYLSMARRESGGAEAEANALLVRAAEELDDPGAQFQLADARYHGRFGFEVDLPAALRLYRAAAEGGDEPDAAVCAAAMLVNGLGCRPDPAAAFALYERAANLGSMDAWRSMAHMYARGLGVKRDEDAARRILELVGPAEDANK